MTSRHKLIVTSVGMLAAFALAWTAMFIETQFQGRGFVKIAVFPSLELCGWVLHRDGWPVIIAALLQFPVYAALFLFAWCHGHFWHGIVMVGTVHVVDATLALLLVLVLTSGCMSSREEPRITRFPVIHSDPASAFEPARPGERPYSPRGSSATQVESGPSAGFRIVLEPESESVAAKLKADDYHRITGDYAYADLKTILNLVGRVSGSYREVDRIEFFERIAASVIVRHPPFSSTQILCSKDVDGVWQVVGVRDYVY